MRTLLAILLVLGTAGPSRTARANSCPADLDGDRVVSVTDLIVVLTDWGCASPPEDACPGDVDGDGVVNVVDLTAVIVGWGACVACTIEDETCGDDTNSGCAGGWFWGTIDCGETICGIAWADGGTRDTDWYWIEISECTTVTATLVADFPGVVFIVGGVERCAPFVIADGDGTGVPAIADLEPGEYIIFVATSEFEGTPCDGGMTGYEVSLECAPCSR